MVYRKRNSSSYNICGLLGLCVYLRKTLHTAHLERMDPNWTNHYWETEMDSQRTGTGGLL